MLVTGHVPCNHHLELIILEHAKTTGHWHYHLRYTTASNNRNIVGRYKNVEVTCVQCRKKG